MFFFHDTDFININKYSLHDIDCFKSREHKFFNINQIIININSDSCNMTNENYINQAMGMCERKINMNIAKNPHLINSIDRKKVIFLSESFYIYHLITNKSI